MDELAKELNFNILNNDNIKNFINELKNIYSSFRYNDVKIEINQEITSQNLATLYLDINENKITKIKSIKFRGNEIISNSDLSEIIKSKVKKLTNLFANNNFKPVQLNTDRQRLLSFYKDKGYADVEINYDVEYFDNNTVIIYFNIRRNFYQLSKINFSNNIKNETVNILLSDYFKSNKFDEKIYNVAIAEQIEKNISNLIKNAGVKFFEINKLVNLKDGKAELLFKIQETNPVYINHINISGNSRTLDYVIRRELEINEGDSFIQVI